MLTKASHQVPNLSQMHPVQTFPLYLPNIHFNIIFPYPFTVPDQVRGPVSHFITTWLLYRDKLLAHSSIPKLEDHPYSAVHDCLFKIFAATIRNLEAVPSIRNSRTRRTVVTGTHKTNQPTNQLTPWRKLLLAKLIVTQIVKFPVFYGT
jgi:hypothetical protein